jgi:hypothetical protein
MPRERTTPPEGGAAQISPAGANSQNGTTTVLRLPEALHARLSRLEANVEALAVCVVAYRGEACTTRCVAVTA